MIRYKLILLIVFFAWGAGGLLAQGLEYGAELDTTYMLIGDQQHLRFKVKSDEPGTVKFPQLKDTITQGVEIISGPVRDSVKGKDGKWEVEESYVITAFDTGIYVIPSVEILVENGDYNSVLRTEPLAFGVNTYKVDEQKGYYDVVSPYQTPVNFAEVLPWILWIAGILAVAGLIVWYILRRRKDKPLFAGEKKTVIPPYETAIGELERLKGEKLWQSGKVKEYYTRLTDAVRQYIADELHIPAMEQTSFETLQALKGNSLVEEKDRDELQGMLQTADFVKFAKSTPLPDENYHNLEVAYDFIHHANSRLKTLKEAEIATETAESGLLEKETKE